MDSDAFDTDAFSTDAWDFFTGESDAVFPTSVSRHRRRLVTP